MGKETEQGAQEAVVSDMDTMIAALDSPDDGEKESSETAETAETKETETETEAKESEEEEKEEGKEEAGTEKKETEKEEEKETPEHRLGRQNAELRSMLRQSTRDSKVMQARLERLEKSQVKATASAAKPKKDEFGLDIEDEDEEKEGIAEPNKVQLSEIEVLQEKLVEVGSAKAGYFDLLVDQMSEMNAYSDVKEVCSNENFAGIFDNVGQKIAEEQGIDPTVAALRVELAVWQKPNPFKYMYQLIKKFHPDYQGKEKEKSAEKSEEKKSPANAPSSISNMGGTGKDAGGWTSKRIDDLPEDQLDQVPHDTYQRYLEGNLP